MCVHNEHRQNWKLKGGEEQPDVNILRCRIGTTVGPGPYCSQRHCQDLCPWCRVVYVNIHGPCYYRRSCKHHWSGLPPGAMLMNEGCAELFLPLIGWSPWENRSCTSPEQHSRAGQPLLASKAWVLVSCPTHLPPRPRSRHFSRLTPTPNPSMHGWYTWRDWSSRIKPKRSHWHRARIKYLKGVLLMIQYW